MLFLFVFEVLLISLFNFFFRNFYDVKINSDSIVLENLWRTKDLPIKELIDIKPLYFIFPYPFNPYLKLLFKRHRQIYTKVSNPIIVHLSKGGLTAYIDSLKQLIAPSL